ncbi:MAG: two-component system phosphate regulon sensor histidine kinase PhoR [Dokdonia sp.]|jgi:two-component system phosphate regulon sensor histidine kinase PhoR
MLKYYFWLMNKKLFYLLILLMSLSLIGIIFVQGYWITNSVTTKREQFEFSAKQALVSVAKKIQNREVEDYFVPYVKLVDSIGLPDDFLVDEFVLLEQLPVSNDVFIYRNGILQQDFKLASPAFDFDLDSIEYKRYFTRTQRIMLDRGGAPSDDVRGGVESQFEDFSRLEEYERSMFAELIMERAAKKPVHMRVSVGEIQRLMSLELGEREMETDFEFAVYSTNLSTRVRSENFELEGAAPTYGVPLLSNKEGRSSYQLYANFPGEKRFVISSIIGMVGLSVIFTIIIIVAYSSALNQLNKQRQISQIKTDFINNMTHEFKTPIATINLALDAIKNPKVSHDAEKVAYYHRMIREENKRMHAQVENVLRISKLEKNELNINKERYKLHDIIEDAVSHLELIVEDRQGYIEKHLDAAKSSILANETHFTNVFVNILDNAVKYSPEAPKIDIYTENVKNFIIVKIQDQGDGMTKAVQRKIFEKFYREHTGNIHNVKGHGLGLAYVKQIVEDHQGEIYVESEKGKGSTFMLKLPLIS